MNGAIPFYCDSLEYCYATISNLFPNLVPCDSKFYFYPVLNQRESICCRSGCHHVQCVGRGAECPPARITWKEQTSSLTVPYTHPVMPLRVTGKRHRKAKWGLIQPKNRARSDSGRALYFVLKHASSYVKQMQWLTKTENNINNNKKQKKTKTIYLPDLIINRLPFFSLNSCLNWDRPSAVKSMIKHETPLIGWLSFSFFATIKQAVSVVTPVVSATQPDWQSCVILHCSDWLRWYVSGENRNCLCRVGVLANRKARWVDGQGCSYAHIHTQHRIHTNTRCLRSNSRFGSVAQNAHMWLYSANCSFNLTGFWRGKKTITISNNKVKTWL